MAIEDQNLNFILGRDDKENSYERYDDKAVTRKQQFNTTRI